MNLIPRNFLIDFDDLWGRWEPLRGLEPAGTISPRVDICEKDDNYEITAELPGIKKDDIKVSLQDGVLMIECVSKEEKEEKDGTMIRQERRYGRFRRSFNLGAGVQESSISASFKDGLLTVSSPKTEPKAPEAHNIQVH